jgi:hypothetical protein
MKVVVHTASTGAAQSSSNRDKKDLAKPKVPRGLRSLATSSSIQPPTNELQALQRDATDIESWWTAPRWKHTKRVYSGECFDSDNRCTWLVCSKQILLKLFEIPSPAHLHCALYCSPLSLQPRTWHASALPPKPAVGSSRLPESPFPRKCPTSSTPS